MTWMNIEIKKGTPLRIQDYQDPTARQMGVVVVAKVFAKRDFLVDYWYNPDGTPSSSFFLHYEDRMVFPAHPGVDKTHIITIRFDDLKRTDGKVGKQWNWWKASI